jgi:hypothetical protein
VLLAIIIIAFCWAAVVIIVAALCWAAARGDRTRVPRRPSPRRRRAHESDMRNISPTVGRGTRR